MKVPCIIVLFVSAYLSESVHANNRSKRQLGGYRFPGPRLSDDYASASRNLVKREPQYEDEYSPRPSAGTSQPGYRSPPASAYQSEPNEYPSRAYAPAASYQRDNKRSNYASGPSEASRKKEEDEPEEERKPSQLELLLAQSKFACSEKKDGYYADTGLGCQVFHYCVQGVKHSWMCPEQTVFHQVHLNCVPAAQDICTQSEKFFVVNDYLHKEYDQRGPNNTIRYHQRYYPEEFLGDAALNLPQSFGFPPEQSAPPAARSQQSAAYSQPKPRPTYSDEADQDTAIPYNNNYRPQSQSYPSAASRDQSSSQPSYRPSGSSSQPSSYPSSQPTYSPAQRRPAAESSPSYPAAYPSYSSYTTPAPPAYRPVSSSGLRYAQSSGSPAVRSYPVTAARATASPYSSYQTPTYPTQSRPTQASYNSSPVYKKVPATSVARYPYTSSYPSLTSSASSSAHDTAAYSPISPAYDSGYSRFNSAFSGSDYPSRFRTGVTYESDY